MSPERGVHERGPEQKLPEIEAALEMNHAILSGLPLRWHPALAKNSRAHGRSALATIDDRFALDSHRRR